MYSFNWQAFLLYSEYMIIISKNDVLLLSHISPILTPAATKVLYMKTLKKSTEVAHTDSTTCSIYHYALKNPTNEDRRINENITRKRRREITSLRKIRRTITQKAIICTSKYFEVRGWQIPRRYPIVNPPRKGANRGPQNEHPSRPQQHREPFLLL